MSWSILHGDVNESLATLPDESVHCCVTSPPYWGLRDYGVVGQVGLEATPEEYTLGMVAVFREVRRVLRADGTLWLNLGDSYTSGAIGGSKVGLNNTLQTGSPSGYHSRPKTENEVARPRPVPVGLKPKDLVGIPWRVAFALQADGWYLRSDIIWAKPNPMPESVTDRPTKSHEYLFLLSRSERYYYDAEAIQEPAARPEGSGNLYPYDVDGQRLGDNANLGGNLHKIGPRETRNKRTVWTVATSPFSEAHFATFPPKLIEPCILAGCPVGGTVLDPFSGSGTTGMVALRHGRNYIGCELNAEYVAMSERRIYDDAPLLNGTAVQP